MNLYLELAKLLAALSLGTWGYEYFGSYLVAIPLAFFGSGLVHCTYHIKETQS